MKTHILHVPEPEFENPCPPIYPQKRPIAPTRRTDDHLSKTGHNMSMAWHDMNADWFKVCSSAAKILCCMCDMYIV